MGTSTSTSDVGLAIHGPLAWITIIAAAAAAVLIIYYLVRRPPMTTVTKLVLLAGIGLFPIAAASTGNIAGFEQTTTRNFCGGCHTMDPWVKDAIDPKSTSLAAMHARNELFGDRNCYTCHADYGMYGTVATKMAGMKHVWMYYGEGFADMSIEEAMPKVHIAKPFPNSTCTHCHSTRLEGWNDVPDHQGLVPLIDKGEVSCASAGCHGPAHPFSKAAQEAAKGGAHGQP
jgi:cytochrome c-type protein NapC